MSFESRCCQGKGVEQQFRADCQTVFGTAEGARVLHRLVQAAHPLAHLPGMTEHDHGNAEVVACLWRYGAATNDLPTNQTHAKQTQT